MQANRKRVLTVNSVRDAEELLQRHRDGNLDNVDKVRVLQLDGLGTAKALLDVLLKVDRPIVNEDHLGDVAFFGKKFEDIKDGLSQVCIGPKHRIQKKVVKELKELSLATTDPVRIQGEGVQPFIGRRRNAMAVQDKASDVGRTLLLLATKIRHKTYANTAIRAEINALRDDIRGVLKARVRLPAAAKIPKQMVVPPHGK